MNVKNRAPTAGRSTRPSPALLPTPSSARKPRGYADSSAFERTQTAARPDAASPTKSTLVTAGETALLAAGAATVAASTSIVLGVGGVFAIGALIRNAAAVIGREGFRDLGLQLTALFGGLLGGGAAGLVAVAQATRAGIKSDIAADPKSKNPVLHPIAAFKNASAKLAQTFKRGKADWQQAPSVTSAVAAGIKTGALLGAQSGSTVGGFGGMVQGGASGVTLGLTTSFAAGPAGIAMAAGLGVVGVVAGTLLGRSIGTVVGGFAGGIVGAFSALTLAPWR